MCESIGHGPLRDDLPKGADQPTNRPTDGQSGVQSCIARNQKDLSKSLQYKDFFFQRGLSKKKKIKYCLKIRVNQSGMRSCTTTKTTTMTPSPFGHWKQQLKCGQKDNFDQVFSHTGQELFSGLNTCIRQTILEETLSIIDQSYMLPDRDFGAVIRQVLAM